MSYLREFGKKLILTWSAFFDLNFREIGATHSCEVQTEPMRLLKQKTLNHWVVGSIPTRFITHLK